MKEYFSLLVAAFLLALVGVCVRFVSGMDSFLIVLFTMFFASLFYLVVIIIKKEKIELKNKRDLLILGASNLGAYGFIFAAFLLIPFSPALFLFYTAPMFVLILSPFLLKEKIQKSSIIAIIIAMTGIFMILNPEEFSNFFTFSNGYILALIAALSYGINLTFARKLIESYKAIPLTFFSHLISFVLMLLLIPFLSNFQNITFENILITAFMGLLAGIGYLLTYYSLARVVVQKVSIVLLTEPLFGTLLAVWLLSEIPTIFTLIGGLLILVAVALVKWT